MTTYHCRQCKKPIFASDAEQGRLHLICRFCKCAQMVFLGNPDGKPLSRELRLAVRSC